MSYKKIYGDGINGYICKDELLGRYRFPGNLKLPIQELQNLSKESRFHITENLRLFRSVIITASRSASNMDFMWKTQLDKDNYLCVENYNGKINFYLHNIRFNDYSQLLTIKQAKVLERTKHIIALELQKCCEERTFSERNILTSQLIRSSVLTETKYKHHLFVQGNTVNDDFNIDV